jgi:hypothetical protein
MSESKLVSQVAKCPVQEQAAALEQLSAAISELQDQGAALRALLPRMTAAGLDSTPMDAPKKRGDQSLCMESSGALLSQMAAMEAGNVQICTGKACAKAGSADVLTALSARHDQNPRTEVGACKCLGQCKFGPNVQLIDDAGASVVVTGVELGELEQLTGLLPSR